MKAFTSSKTAAYCLSVVIILCLWKFSAYVMNAPLILPPPENVFHAFTVICGTAVFWQHVAATVVRCFFSFLISVLLGTALGVLCGSSPFFNNLLAFPIAIIRATPVVSFILVALFWFTSSHVPLFVSVLMTLPIMISSVAGGFLKRDEKLAAMAQIYQLTKLQKLRWITAPSVVPFFLSGSAAAFGLTWKVVVAGEVLCIPAFGAGSLLQKAQVHLNTAEVLAVTFVVVMLSFALEKLFLLVAAKMQKRRA